MDSTMFFSDWSGLSRIVVVGLLAYLGLVLLLRISGKRTLSKMNSFDWVVTVALGSTLSAVIIQKSVPLAEGLAALGLLILLQFAFTWMSVRSELFSSWIKAQPTLLFYRGTYLRKTMRSERITQEEIEASMRSEGLTSAEQAEAVVLETNGNLTVLKKQDGSVGSRSARLYDDPAA